MEEAKRTRFGEPTDGAILQRWWIETEDSAAEKHREFRATFESACAFLGLEPAEERKRLLREIDDAWRHACLAYRKKRLELRTRAVMATAGCPVQMTKTLALLLVSHIEYEDTAGLNRADPPARKAKALHRVDAQAASAA